MRLGKGCHTISKAYEGLKKLKPHPDLKEEQKKIMNHLNKASKPLQEAKKDGEHADWGLQIVKSFEEINKAIAVIIEMREADKANK